jgi:hypothetical protein
VIAAVVPDELSKDDPQILCKFVLVVDGGGFEGEVEMNPYLFCDCPHPVDNLSVPFRLCPLA